jgi:DNA-binding SARP family transcriptional activator
MEFRILGPLEVLHDGRRLELAGNRPRALLALFLLHANETLTRDRIVDELWGEDTPAGAAKSLQMQIHRLRRALADDQGSGRDSVIVTREGGYELTVAADSLDSSCFERLLAEGRAELAAERPGPALARFEEALAMWRGPPLADLAYEPFAQHEIARLEDLRVNALEQLIEAKLGLGRHAEVVSELEVLIHEHPYRERMRFQLMLALYRCDRQAEALQAYQDARRTLVDELGIEPGHSLRELERAILAQDPALRSPAAEAAGVDAAPGRPHRAFVGRDREVAELGAGLDSALAGHGQVILLSGEPGIGKSRLADTLLQRARARDAAVLVGRCWEAGGAPAYWPWIDAFRGHVRDSASDVLLAQLGDGAADLAQLLPELRERFPDLPPPSLLEGEGARFRLFDAVRSFLRGAARARPLVIILDDLHAADEPSLLLLQYVARGLGDSRVLVLGAYRDVDPALSDPLTSALGELVRERHTSHIELTGLSPSNVGEYVELSTGVEAPPGLIEAIHQETEGNPLFVAEVVHLLAAEGRVDQADTELRIPPGIRAVIERRLARLSERCRELLAPASVFGREFGLDALTELSRLTPGEVLDVLDEAMTERVLDDAPGAIGRLRFGHALIRDTLYDGLTAASRMQLHREVGEALEATYAADPEPHLAELAQHFVAAAPLGLAEKAVEYSRRAGDRAAAQLAFEEAARHYEIALTLVAPPAARCEMLLSLGDAQARAGNSAAAKEAFREAADLAEAGGLAHQLARAAVAYGGRFAWARGSADPALVPLLERALSAIGKQDVGLRIRLLARLAASIRDHPSRERRARLGEEALRLARDQADPATLAAAVEGHWIAVEGPDRYGRGDGVAVGDELIALGERIGDRERVFAGHDHRLHCLWVLADRPGIDAELETLSALAAELRQPPQHWALGTGEAMLALMEGRFDEAERLVAETLAIGERTESWNALVSQRLALFVLHRAQGRLRELEETIDRSVREYPSLPRFRAALAHLHAELGREPAARVLVDTLLTEELNPEHMDAEWHFTMCLLAQPCARLAEEDASRRLYESLLPYERLYAVAPVEATFGSGALALGVLATAIRSFDDAQRHLELAIELERGMRARPWLAHAQHELARMLVARGDRRDSERARVLAGEAKDTYRALGMDVWAARVAQRP